jgi:predicted tellurium resistance membrane protein TerC
MTELIVALVTLTILEIILGVDNVIFVSILSGKLPKSQQKRARRIGMLAAMLMRIALLFAINWISRLTEPLVNVFSQDISGRDLILLGGGLFLIAKSTFEIHDRLEGASHDVSRKPAASFASVIGQVMLLDIVFSLDSVITAIGMANDIRVMVAAVILAVLVMMKHPTIKVLALAFLLLIGISLVAEGLGQHIPKGYIYFAMAFSVAVEFVNIRVRKKVDPVKLHQHFVE